LAHEDSLVAHISSSLFRKWQVVYAAGCDASRVREEIFFFFETFLEFARIFTCLCVRGTDAELSDEKARACIRKEEEGFSEAGFSDDDHVLSASYSSGQP
jgi:hypothetical protein